MFCFSDDGTSCPNSCAISCVTWATHLSHWEVQQGAASRILSTEWDFLDLGYQSQVWTSKYQEKRRIINISIWPNHNNDYPTTTRWWEWQLSWYNLKPQKHSWPNNWGYQLGSWKQLSTASASEINLLCSSKLWVHLDHHWTIDPSTCSDTSQLQKCMESWEWLLGSSYQASSNIHGLCWDFKLYPQMWPKRCGNRSVEVKKMPRKNLVAAVLVLGKFSVWLAYRKIDHGIMVDRGKEKKHDSNDHSTNKKNNNNNNKKGVQ